MLTLAQLRNYQHRALAFLLPKDAAALFLDMGLGKTIIVLTAIVHWILQGRAKRFLVIGPIRVIETVWAQEAKKWEHTQHLKVVLVRGTVKEREAILRRHADIYLINPEAVIWLIRWMKINGCPFDGLVVDESSAFKSSSTRRWKALRLALSMFHIRVILTGTPTPNSLMELWPQIFLLDMGLRLGTAFYRFRDRFFESDYMGYNYTIREGAADYIYEQLSDLVMRLDAKDWLNIPPILNNAVEVVLPEETLKMYKKFEEDMFLELDQTNVMAFNAAALSMRCHQIANGAIFNQDLNGDRLPGNPWRELHTSKIEALQEIIESTGSPVIVAYRFQHDLARLRKVYPAAPWIGGHQEEDTEVIKQRWIAGKIPVLLVNPQSAGHGMNDMEQGGHTIIFFSMTWSREQHDQLIARISGARAVTRGTPTIVHYLIAKDTVDEAIRASNNLKGTGQRKLLNALRDYQSGHLDILS